MEWIAFRIGNARPEEVKRNAQTKREGVETIWKQRLIYVKQEQRMVGGKEIRQEKRFGAPSPPTSVNHLQEKKLKSVQGFGCESQSQRKILGLLTNYLLRVIVMCWATCRVRLKLN